MAYSSLFLFIYLLMAVLGLRFCARASSRHGKRGPPFIAVRGPPTIAASPVAEHRLQTRRLSNCGSGAQPLRGTRDPPGPGPEPACPASAGRLPTAAPPGKPNILLNSLLYTVQIETPATQGGVCQSISLHLQEFGFWLVSVLKSSVLLTFPLMFKAG